MKFKATRRTKGFTLIELLVVIAILATLGSIVWVAWGSFANRKEYATAQAQIHVLSECVEAYHTDNNELPWGEGDEDSANTLYQIVSGDFNGDSQPEKKQYCRSLQYSELGDDSKPTDIFCEKTGRGKYAIVDPWGGHYRYIVGYDVKIEMPDTPKKAKKVKSYGEGPGFNNRFDIFSQGPDYEGDGLDNEGENSDNISNCAFK